MTLYVQALVSVWATTLLILMQSNVKAILDIIDVVRCVLGLKQSVSD